uniref:Uncharacterized protein n=1 Tax=Glossina brevipalpis TaxID=37001 RepID=A0A1A9WF41_9MUSC
MDKLLSYQKKCVVGLDKLCGDAANVRGAQVIKRKTFADVARVSAAVAGTHVVIKARIKYDTLKTKSDLTKNIDSKSIKFSDVRCKRNGTIVFNYGGEDDRNKAKAAIEGSLPEGPLVTSRGLTAGCGTPSVSHIISNKAPTGNSMKPLGEANIRGAYCTSIACICTALTLLLTISQ